MTASTWTLVNKASAGGIGASRIGHMTLRADAMAHSDADDSDQIWERLTRPMPDGAIAGDAADWDAIIFEIVEALEPGNARVPGRHARRNKA